MANRLQHETSPYLLQHAHNPVDWYPWCEEAFDKARRENKPVLVSIGYATCHWCHVMERESFEDPEVAVVMNLHFVNIKVDREERPDIDQIYMEAVQILSGSGGWPLNVFLLPDRRPFYGGTYFPPVQAHGRASWRQVLLAISKAYREQYTQVEEQATKLMEAIVRNEQVFVQRIGPEPPADTFHRDWLDTAYYQLRERFDRVEGGFGGAPKFPSTFSIEWLLRYYFHTRNPEAIEHAELSLQKMIAGGIYDQLGGGFARYATDREWLVPHFEKMLYDNALLVSAIANAYSLTQQPLYRDTIEHTLAYVAREMTNSEGGFYSAQDADSEGTEGKFFVWSPSEIAAILGPEAAEEFCDFYGVTEQGNWEHTNILSCVRPDWQQLLYSTPDAHQRRERLQHYRQVLLEHRAKRIPPLRDEKILLAWNALMTSAYVRAAQVLANPEYATIAVRNIQYLLQHLSTQPADQIQKAEAVPLWHTYKDGQAKYAALLDDYSYWIAALLDVYTLHWQPDYLRLATAYADYVIKHFYDIDTSLFWYTPAHQRDVVVRQKDLYDNATPAGNSTMLLVLQRLHIYTGRADFAKIADRMSQSMADAVQKYPAAFGRWLLGLTAQVFPLRQVAIIGTDYAAAAASLQRSYQPDMVLMAASAPNHDLPLLAHRAPAPGQTLYFLCQDFACQLPTDHWPY